MSQVSEITKYLRLLYKKRYLVILASLISMTLLIAGSFLMPKKYEADSTVFIEKNVIDDLVKGIAVTPDLDARIRVLRYFMLSRDLITKVLSDLDVDAKVRNGAALNEIVSDLQKRTQINLRDKEGLFTVSIVDNDPHFAQAYINKLVSSYVEENVAGKRDQAYGANRFLDEQLASFKQKLDKAEEAIINFRKSQGIYLAGGEKSVLDNIQGYEKEIENLNLNVAALRARRGRLAEQLRVIPKRVAVFSEGQRADRLSALKLQLHQMLLNYTDQYPDVVKLKAEIAALQKKDANGAGADPPEMTSVNPVYQGTQQKALGLEAEISSYLARKHKLEEIVEQQKGALRDAPEVNKQLADLQQQRDSLANIYEQLLNRMGQSEVSKQMEIGNKASTFRIVDPALLPLAPIAPNMVRMILISIFGGILAGIGLVLLLEQLNPAVMEVDQLRGLGLEVLAVIPSIDDEERDRRVRRTDRLVYALAGGYFLCIFGLLVFEFVSQAVLV